MPLINYHLVLTQKSMFSFKSLSFGFSLKETLTLLTMLVKTLQSGKWYRKILSLIQSKELAEISSSISFQFSSNDNIEYLQVLVVQRRFCQLQINSPEMASLYIYKLKINAKLQEKTFARWDMSIHHVPTVSCVNLKVKVLFLMFWSVVMVDLRQQRNQVFACLETIKTN